MEESQKPLSKEAELARQMVSLWRIFSNDELDGGGMMTLIEATGIALPCMLVAYLPQDKVDEGLEHSIEVIRETMKSMKHAKETL